MGTETSDVVIEVGRAALPGQLVLPECAVGLVVFAHGSGSSRHSPRNRAVAARFHEDALGTLLFDLLTPEEEQQDAVNAEYRFDIALLAGRLEATLRWLSGRPEGRHRLGCFGASTGAAAALVAAASAPGQVAAVVSRGGRPDLAAEALERVDAPTLLIVGGADHQVLELNRWALARLRCEKQLAVVPGATHLFPEPGALASVADLAAEWFVRYLSGPRPGGGSDARRSAG